MALQDTLNLMKADFVAKAPKEAVEIMTRATEDLKASDLMKGFLNAGDQAPEFTLTDQTGAGVSSTALLAKGPLVVSFYRGVW
jgi:hypothetical protein